MSFNQVILLGNLGKDPELKHTKSGTAVANLSLATEESYKKNDVWTKQVEWHNVIVWGAAAEAAAKNLSKGSRVFILGAIKTRSWEDKGEKKFRTEVIASKITYLTNPDKKSNSKPSSKPKTNEPEFDDNDIPF